MRATTLKASADRLDGLLDYYAGLADDQKRQGPGRGPVDYYLDPNETSRPVVGQRPGSTRSRRFGDRQ